MFGSFADNVGRAGVVAYRINKPVGTVILGFSAFLDGLKHLSLAVDGSLDPSGLVIDFVVPVAVTPLGKGAGEALSQATESGVNYLEENYR